MTELSDVFIDVDRIDDAFLSLSCVPESRIVEPKRRAVGRRGDHKHFKHAPLTANFLQQFDHRYRYTLPTMGFNNPYFVKKQHWMWAVNSLQFVGKGEPNWFVVLDSSD